MFLYYSVDNGNKNYIFKKCFDFLSIWMLKWTLDNIIPETMSYESLVSSTISNPSILALNQIYFYNYKTMYKLHIYSTK